MFCGLGLFLSLNCHVSALGVTAARVNAVSLLTATGSATWTTARSLVFSNEDWCDNIVAPLSVIHVSSIATAVKWTNTVSSFVWNILQVHMSIYSDTAKTLAPIFRTATYNVQNWESSISWINWDNSRYDDFFCCFLPNFGCSKRWSGQFYCVFKCSLFIKSGTIPVSTIWFVRFHNFFATPTTIWTTFACFAKIPFLWMLFWTMLLLLYQGIKVIYKIYNLNRFIIFNSIWVEELWNISDCLFGILIHAHRDSLLLSYPRDLCQPSFVESLLISLAACSFYFLEAPDGHASYLAFHFLVRC